MKRFYKQVSVTGQADGYVINLDERIVKTPGKKDAVAPTLALAEAIKAEWETQEEEIDPKTMPMTRYLNTALERVGTQRPTLIDELVKYGGSDMVCYRSDDPEELVSRQQDIWGPLLTWLSKTHDIHLAVTSGIIHVEQDEAELEKLDNLISGFDDFQLSAFHNMTTLTGSVTIALNLISDSITVEQAWEAAILDEAFQAERWGWDYEAEKRNDLMKQDLEDAVRFVKLLA